jgi:hypothetical protein
MMCRVQELGCFPKGQGHTKRSNIESLHFIIKSQHFVAAA